MLLAGGATLPWEMNGGNLTLVLISTYTLNTYTKWTGFQKLSHFPPLSQSVMKRDRAQVLQLPSITKDSKELLLQHLYSIKTWVFYCWARSAFHVSCCLRKEVIEGLSRYLYRKLTYLGQSKPLPLVFVAITQEPRC